MSERPLILLHQVTRSYQVGMHAVHALRGITMGISAGDFVAIMGQSGSGKSTLMNILGCLDLPTRGRYLLDDVDVRHLSEDVLPFRSRIDHPRYLAYVPGEGTWPGALGDLIEPLRQEYQAAMLAQEG